MDADPVYAAASALISGRGAFLRCDRGDALYVTNLPMKCERADDVRPALARAGFSVTEAGGCLYLTPADAWMDRFGQWALEQTAQSPLTIQLMKRRGYGISAPERALWIAGLKTLRVGRSDGYEKRLRRTAAEALRLRAGGGLWACGLINDMNEQYEREDRL